MCDSNRIPALAIAAVFCCCVTGEAQDFDPFEFGFPLIGEAQAGWESDDTATLWYEQDTGELKLFAARQGNGQLAFHGFTIFAAEPAFVAEVNSPALSGSFDVLTATSMSKVGAAIPFTDVAFGPIMRPNLTSDFFFDSVAVSALFREAAFSEFDYVVSTAEFPRPAPPVQEYVRPGKPPTPGKLQPGDAEQDLDFDQFDIIRTFIASGGKYQTGEPATWGEGDWDAGPGNQGAPPTGNGVFDNRDLVAAQQAGFYLSGPYDSGPERGLSSAPVVCCGALGDARVSLVYDPTTGELAVDAPANQRLTTLNIESQAGVFTGDAISSRVLPGSFDIDTDHAIFKAMFGSSFESISFGNVAQRDLSSEFLLQDLSAIGTLAEGGLLQTIDLVYRAEASPILMAGDADQDLDFDQLDLIQVQVASKFLTGQAATWGEGDWNGAPGGRPGEPPAGDAVFNQVDIVAALAGNTYMTGPYAALGERGQRGDGRTSIVYNAVTGELAVDVPSDHELTSIHITSAAGVFVGDSAQNLGGAFDNDADDNIFKATFGSSFSSLSFGNVARAGLSEERVRNDLTVLGSLDGGGALGGVDLIYVPEPATTTFLFTGLFLLLLFRRPIIND